MSDKITLLLGSELSVSSGAGSSTTVGDATLVRIYNSHTGVNVITVTDPTGVNGYSGVGSFTVHQNHVEYIQKQPGYTIHGSAAFKAVKVGFTD
tara:strand:+ start:758 stop:1039 length:282 start_codon:yes stop_codon:yes gene_type:complete